MQNWIRWVVPLVVAVAMLSIVLLGVGATNTQLIVVGGGLILMGVAIGRL